MLYFTMLSGYGDRHRSPGRGFNTSGVLQQKMHLQPGSAPMFLHVFLIKVSFKC